MVSGNVGTTTRVYRVYYSQGKPLGIKRSQNNQYDLSFPLKIPPSFAAVNKYTSYKYFWSIQDEKIESAEDQKTVPVFSGEVVLKCSAEFVLIKSDQNNDNNEKSKLKNMMRSIAAESFHFKISVTSWLSKYLAGKAKNYWQRREFSQGS